MSDLPSGLARFLSETWSTTVTIANLSQSTAGARRSNILFDAVTPERTVPLVATIMPTAAIQLNSIVTESQVRDLAELGGVPVPHIHAVCEDDSYVGGPFMVSTRVDGETVPRRVLRLVEQVGNGATIVGQIGTALAKLHAIDVAAAPPALIGPGDRNPCEVALTSADAVMSELLQPSPAIALGMRWLERRLPGEPKRRTIVHSDVRNGNIIVGEDGLRAILDWEGSRIGDPMEDMAWPSLRMWRFREDHHEIGGFAGRAPLIEAYTAAGGDFDLDRYEWWKVLGTLRWGMGLANQAHQHLDGSFTTVVMAASGRRVAELEWDLLMLIRP